MCQKDDSTQPFSHNQSKKHTHENKESYWRILTQRFCNHLPIPTSRPIPAAVPSCHIPCRHNHCFPTSPPSPSATEKSNNHTWGPLSNRLTCFSHEFMKPTQNLGNPIQTDRQMDRHTDRQTNRHTGKQTNRQMYRHTNRQIQIYYTQWWAKCIYTNTSKLNKMSAIVYNLRLQCLSVCLSLFSLSLSLSLRSLPSVFSCPYSKM